MRTEGNMTETREVKMRGTPVGYESSHDGSRKFADYTDYPVDLKMVGFEAGRTIELRRFEFCRIKLRLRLRMIEGLPKGEVEAAAERFIISMLEREEKSVSGQRMDVHIPDHDSELLMQCVHRSVGVQYGLTLKSGTKEYESHSVDVIEEMPVSDGADLVAAFEVLSDEMAEKLDRHHKRIKEG